MLRLGRYASLAFSGLLFISCAQVLGLNNLEPDEEDGGSGNRSGASSTGGKGGAGGSSGSSGSSNSGEGGMGGEDVRPTGGEGGTAGTGAVSGSGGSAGSEGGGKNVGGASGTSGSAGTAGTGGTTVDFVVPDDCSEVTEITVTLSRILTGTDPQYFMLISPDIGETGADEVELEIYTSGTYNGETTGTFELSADTTDGSYSTCSRCVMAWEDTSTRYFALGGSMTVSDATDHVAGSPTITFSDVTLVESEILDVSPYTSTPVPNARCLHIESAELVWTCNPDYFGQNDTSELCDCGCGSLDPNCPSSSEVDCDYCSCTGECDPDDNSQCL